MSDVRAKLAMTNEWLRTFVVESNRIEGIVRVPTWGEVAAHEVLLALHMVLVSDVEAFVADVAGMPLRRAKGQDVRVGGYFPPPGGPAIEQALSALLVDVNTLEITAHAAHVRYEKLHPFLDGNGRSGRALWAWQTSREGRDPFSLPFLHRWYYESLEHSRAPVLEREDN